MRLWQRAHWHVAAQGVARAPFGLGIEGRREAGDRADRDDGRAGPQPAAVLGRSSFDTRNQEFAQMAANMVLLDRLLAHYGADAKPARASLRGSVEEALAQVWPDENFHPTNLAPASTNPEAIFEIIQSLSPQNDTQRSVKSQALATATNLAQSRWLMFAQATESPIPIPFLVVLVFWLCIIFASFGLYAPGNLTVVTTLGVCALSVAGAIFLILELALPFAGVIRVSSAPLRGALAHLGQ